MPSAQNSLRISYLDPSVASREQIRCSSSAPGQSGILTYLNVTRSKSQIYTFRVPQISLTSPHQFVNVKFNAILFNQRNNPSFSLMVIDDNDRRIYNEVVQANETTFNCAISPSTRLSSAGFYVVIRLSTATTRLLMQITTTQIGDELGISDLLVYAGNCDIGCASCDGPGPNQCRSCSNFLTYNSAQKSCVDCPTRFYKANSMCIPCPYNC